MKLFTILFVMCFIALAPMPTSAQNSDGSGNVGLKGAGACPQPPCAPVLQVLVLGEAEALLHMWEEERLAQEVYQIFFERWQSSIFSNIAASEARHVAAMKKLIDRYRVQIESHGLKVTDPVTGEFPTLQDLYDVFTERGKVSLQAALQVGVEIEELDIVDLGLAMGITDNTDIDAVYANLLAGSLKHLAAFTSHLMTVSPPAIMAAMESTFEVEIVISPSTLNLLYQGEWVTVHAEIAYSEVDAGSVTLDGIPAAATFADNRGELVAKFALGDVEKLLQPGTVALTLSGSTEAGDFSGTDTIRVIQVKGKP